MAQFFESFNAITTAQMVEGSTLFIILLLALILFFKSSSPLGKYFIPLVCIAATILRFLYWVQYGNEPQFMTPLVSLMADLLS